MSNYPKQGMRSRLAHLARLAGLASLLLAACAPGNNTGQTNETASRILTAVATRTTATSIGTSVASAATATATVPTSPTPAEPTATPQPPMVFARCIVRAELSMRQEPGEAAEVTAPLQVSDIVTAYGRTADGQWILTWNREITFGWIPSNALGCSAPFEDLRPTEPDVLRTPQPTVARPEPMAGVATTAPASVAAVVAGTGTPAATETSVPEPTATELPATETAMPAATTTLPAATETSAPTATESPATATVTPTAQVTATTAITPTLAPAAPTVTVAATEAPLEPLACVVAINRALNLRAGPDRTTRLLGQLRPGAKFSATGRNTDATWLYGATARGDFGWVIASAVRCDGDTGGLPVVNGG